MLISFYDCLYKTEPQIYEKGLGKGVGETNISDEKLRREKILELLSSSRLPVSGTELARLFGVSRQVIVQDIALLRASSREILSTNKGYLLFRSVAEESAACMVVMVKHTSDQVFDEFAAIVELGGRVLDVSVDHDYYGQIQIDLLIQDLNDAKEFVQKMKNSSSQPLKCLTGDVHYHTIAAPSEKVLNIIRRELREKGFLVEEDNQGALLPVLRLNSEIRNHHSDYPDHECKN